MQADKRHSCSFIAAYGLFLLLGLLAAHPASAQNADYQVRPRLDFSFQHLDLGMQVDPRQGTVSGEAAWRVEANVDGADSLVLDAAHMEIMSVSVDDAGADYHMHNDSLFVFVADSISRGTSYRVNVTYRAEPRFGLLRSDEGTLWTSRLPRSNRHWVPLPDHPRVRFTLALSMSVPSGYRVMAPGRQTGEQVETVDRVTYRFESAESLAAPDLAWAVGRLAVDETSFGNKRMVLYTEQGAAGDSLRQDLLRAGTEALGQLEDTAGREYPRSRLHILLLDDHRWETKTWGASTVFLYRNMGPLRVQLRRALAAQWFGAWQREERWADAEAMNLYQTLLAGGEGEERLLSPGDRPADSAAAVTYGVFGPDRWNLWQRALPAWEAGGRKEVIRESIGGVLAEGPGVYSWEDYASHWYRSSGQPLFSPPDLSAVLQGGTGMQPGAGVPRGPGAATDSVIYRVDYRLSEADGSLRLVFSALRGVRDELTALRGIVVGAGGGRDTMEVTFTGRRDSVQVTVPPTARTFTLDASSHADLYLEQYKPAPYLIYELRNAELLDQRVEAARRLGSHAGNPDLQLAIQDFMGSDPHPRVRAALLLSLADITGGAAGTEQQFLDALDSDSPEIREAAMMALQNYPGSEPVRTRVESLAMEADEGTFYRNAVRVLSSISSREQLNDFTTRVIRSDTLGRKAIFAIGLLSGAGATGQAVDYAEHYTVPRFSYDVRSRAIRLLTQFDRAAADWVPRAKELLGDRDPRIRYLAVQALASFGSGEARELLQNHLAEEYDARVRPASTSRSP